MIINILCDNNGITLARFNFLSMKLTPEQIQILKDLMIVSAQKGNIPNSGLVLEHNTVLATAESWCASACDMTAHSERLLVTLVGQLKHSNYTPGLTMVSVVEPCLMCLSAAAQAGYRELAYIIPAKRYIEKMPYITNDLAIDKQKIAGQFTEPIALTHLTEYEEEFCKVFENSMKDVL